MPMPVDKNAQEHNELGWQLKEREYYREASICFHLAAQKGLITIANALIEKGEDVNARNNDGNTPLYLAEQKGIINIANVLIEKGADVNARNNYSITPLYLA